MTGEPAGPLNGEAPGPFAVLDHRSRAPARHPTARDRSYALLQKNPSHPSLHFKKIGQFWSSRVGIHYRALALEAEQDLIWFWVGPHAEYDKLVGRKPAARELPRIIRARKKAKPRRPPRKTRG